MRGEVNVSEAVHLREDVVDGVDSDRDGVNGREIEQNRQVQGVTKNGKDKNRKKSEKKESISNNSLCVRIH